MGFPPTQPQHVRTHTHAPPTAGSEQEEGLLASSSSIELSNSSDSAAKVQTLRIDEKIAALLREVAGARSPTGSVALKRASVQLSVSLHRPSLAKLLQGSFVDASAAQSAVGGDPEEGDQGSSGELLDGKAELLQRELPPIRYWAWLQYGSLEGQKLLLWWVGFLYAIGACFFVFVGATELSYYVSRGRKGVTLSASVLRLPPAACCCCCR